jgi:hypothetical protein
LRGNSRSPWRAAIVITPKPTTKAYQAAGYAPDRGNAARLAADPRVKAVADEAVSEALERNGLRVEYPLAARPRERTGGRF